MDVPRADTAELAQLADTLWSACSALDELAYELVALHLVLVADLRHLVRGSLDRVLVARDELERIEARRLAVLGGLPSVDPTRPPTVAAVAGGSPLPWRRLLLGHRDHLRPLLDEVERTSVGNAGRCGATLLELDAALALLRAGRAVRTAPRLVTAGANQRRGERSLLDDVALPVPEEALRGHQRVLAETARVMTRPVAPALRTFLG